MAIRFWAVSTMTPGMMLPDTTTRAVRMRPTKALPKTPRMP
jgi:hypothetical protein